MNEVIVRCYVCKKYVKKIKAVYIGNNIYRHSKCETGSKSWLQSEVAMESEFYDIYTKLQREGGFYERDSSNNRQRDLGD